MKHKLFITCCCLLLSTSIFAQQSLQELLAQADNLNFNELLAQAERYFEQKQAISGLEETINEVLRDDEYTKFMRWKNYWEELLNPDGTLGDPTAYWRSQLEGNTTSERSISPYSDVQWTNISHQNYMDHQIGMGRTTSMAFHPTDPKIFYVGAAIGGIWKTTDGGKSYIPLGDNLPFMAVSSIVIDQDHPDTIYIAVSDVISSYPLFSLGVYKSLDGGLSWSPTILGFDFTDEIGIYKMEADPKKANKIFVATNKGLYRTDDGFTTVTKLDTVNTFDIQVHLDNSNIVYQGGDSGQFYRSIDGGDSFSLMQDFGDRNIHIALSYANSSKVYAVSHRNIYESKNEGQNFLPINSPPTPESETFSRTMLAVAPLYENILLTGNFETYRSNNNGTSYFKTSDWLGEGLTLVHADQREVFINPLEKDYIYYCNDGGVYRYIISTNKFENLSDGLIITQYYDIAVAQTDESVISGGSQDNGNIFRDQNGVWQYHASTADGMYQEIDPTDANTRYWCYQNGVIHRWHDGSNKDITPAEQKDENGDGKGAWETPYQLDPSNSNRIIAGYDRVYKSNNKGDSWQEISPVLEIIDPSGEGLLLTHIAITPTDSNRIYAIGNLALYVKNTFNNEWKTELFPLTLYDVNADLLPSAKISDLEVSPTDLNTIYITIAGFDSGKKVYKSSDAGFTWENISGLLPNVPIRAIETYHRQVGGLFIGTDAGVYYKDDSTPSWQLYGELPHTCIEDIEIQYSNYLIRVGTYGRGVLEAPIELGSRPSSIIGEELSTDLWSAGWTTAEFYTMNGQNYLFLMKEKGYSNSGTNVIIHKMNADGTVGDLVKEHRWSEGWTKAEFFKTSNGQLHLFLLKEKGLSGSGTNAEIYQVNVDGTIGRAVRKSRWSEGWTTTEFFEVNWQPYLFLLKESGRSNAGHNAQVYKVNSNGTVGDLVRGYNWSEGWTTVTPFYVGNKAYLFFLKEQGRTSSNSNVNIHEMNADGTVGRLVEEHDWSSGWTKAEFVKSQGRTYLFMLKKEGQSNANQNVHIYEMNGDGSVGNKMEGYEWSEGWTTAEFFPNILDRPNRLFLLKAATGSVSIHNIR